MHRRAARLGPDRADRLVGDDAEAEEGDGHDEPEGEDAALEDEAFEGVEPRGPGVRQRVQSDEREGREPESRGAGASYGVLLSGNLYLVLPPGLTKRQTLDNSIHHSKLHIICSSFHRVHNIFFLPGRGAEDGRWNVERHVPGVRRQLAVHPRSRWQLRSRGLHHARPLSHQRVVSLFEECQLDMTQASA